MVLSWWFPHVNVEHYLFSTSTTKKSLHSELGQGELLLWDMFDYHSLWRHNLNRPNQEGTKKSWYRLSLRPTALWIIHQL